MPDTVPPLTLAERFTRLITGLRGAIGNYVAENRSVWRMTDEVVRILCRRRTRFEALFARFRAGTLPAPRPARPRAARPVSPETAPPQSAPPESASLASRRPSGAAAVPVRPVLSMPRRRGWLTVMMGWQVAAYANEGIFKAFLDHPDMAEFLAAAPQAGRLLRPIWWMVSTHPLPELLRLPPRPRVRRARPKRAVAASRVAAGSAGAAPSRTVWPGSGGLRPRVVARPRSGPFRG